MQVAFIGLPGVGKSTLLNSLLRRYTDETASAPLVAYPTEGIFEDLLAVPSASSSSSGIAPDIDNLFGGGDTQTSSEAFNRAQQNGYIGRFSSHSPLLCNAWPATHVPVHITTGPEWTVTIRYRSAEDVHASISRLRNAVRRLRAEKESPDIGDPSSLQDALASVGLFPSLCLADVDPETIVLPARTRQCLRPGYYIVRRLSIRSRLNALAHFEMVRAQLLRLTVGFWSNSGLIEAVKVTMPSRAMHADGVFFSDFAGFSDTFARRARDFEHTVDADAATIVVLAGGPRESLLERARAPISFIPTWAARRHRSLPLLVVEFHADDSSYSLWRVRLRDGSPSEPMLLWSRLAIDDAAARLRIAVRQYAIDCRRRGLTQVVRDAVNVDIGASLGLAHALSQSIARLDNDARRPVAAWSAQANADEAGMAVATFFEKHYILHVRPRFCDRVAATAMSDALLRAFADIEARYFGTWPPPIGGLLGDSANTQLHVLYGTVVRPMAQALAAASRGAVDFISSWLTSDAVGHVGSLVAPLFEAEQDGCSSALSGAQHALVDTLRRIVEARTRAWADDMAFSVEEIAREAAAPLANAVATSLVRARSVYIAADCVSLRARQGRTQWNGCTTP